MTRPTSPNLLLLLAAAFDAGAALIHVGCIIFGASWYRFFGAGERIATMASRGHWYPTILTSLIVLVFALWALYALSGAGVIRPLPLTRTALTLIAAVYLFRGLAFAPFRQHFPGNSASFWLWTSAICTVAGLVHLAGLWQVWGRLRTS